MPNWVSWHSRYALRCPALPQRLRLTRHCCLLAKLERLIESIVRLCLSTGVWLKMLDRQCLRAQNTALLRGRSSVGRAREWHSRGRRFDPVRLHQDSCPHRLVRPRTPPFHGGNRGSNPLGDAIYFNNYEGRRVRNGLSTTLGTTQMLSFRTD